MTPLEALQRTRELLERSKGSAWSQKQPPEISAQLDHAIAALKNGSPFDRLRLRMLFAPTGAVQETAIDNGWGEEFLTLSEVLDAELEEHRG